MLNHRLRPTPVDYDFIGLRGAVDDALATPDRALVVDLDGVGFLDAAIIRELIRGLRRLRERGGSLRVQASRPAVVLSLKATGLDRIFCNTVAA
ncbi:MAG: STAS domain-containing protein [Candidatus Eremiobacteraeota bacterium]|nr:STAS domain-containing protein [Candidatus Eremiobacteraeota bacterium]MBV8582731.1 STAS domain-containing protein [Candidatus Eremiobacteraeota bacterium]